MHPDVEVAIIGAGASGLMLASLIANKVSVAVLDANNSLAPKLKISGGGKCNATNVDVSSQNFLGNDAFVSATLAQFSNHDLINFFVNNGLQLQRVDRVVKGQMFAQDSKQIIDILKTKAKKANFLFGSVVHSAQTVNNLFEITYNNNQKIRAEKLVIASGGLSYASLGASDIGYNIAKSFGHTIISPKPALVGFTAQKEEFWFKDLSGVSIQAKISVANKSFEGGFLFTHKGMSGPIVLNASLWWEKGQISLDFLPQINKLETILKSNQNKHISSAIPLPKNFIKAFLQKMNLEDKKVATLSKKELEQLSILKNYNFAPAGTFGYAKAEATKGGVATDEICPKTFESKKTKNLFFIGEILDVTGELGGYNIQWAFSSAFVCAKNWQ